MIELAENAVPEWRVRALQDSLDYHGRVRAGWLLTQVDLAACSAGERLAQGPVVAVAVNTFQLQVPLHVGEQVSFHVECLRKGQKSMVLKTAVWAERADGSQAAVTEVVMTYVAVDEHGKSRLMS